MAYLVVIGDRVDYLFMLMVDMAIPYPGDLRAGHSGDCAFLFSGSLQNFKKFLGWASVGLSLLVRMLAHSEQFSRTDPAGQVL